MCSVPPATSRSATMPSPGAYSFSDARDRGTGGSGLGLAIVREVVRAHDGEITLADSPLGGPRAEIRFPRIQSTG